MAEIKQNRAFKGVWIPKEVWLSKELTLQEKVFLVEIESLDNEQGCFASNAYFSEFFELSVRRVIGVIKELESKGFIEKEVYYKQGSKEIEKRVIKVVKKAALPHEESCTTPHEESCVDNNTSINNTNNNNICSAEPNVSGAIPEKVLLLNGDNDMSALSIYNFNLIYREYPKKVGKSKGFTTYKNFRKGKKDATGRTVKLTNEQIYDAVVAYADDCREKGTDMKYIKNFDTFMNNILDYIE